MKTILQVITVIGCALGLHAWTPWVYHWQRNSAHMKTRCCRNCPASQVRSA